MTSDVVRSYHLDRKTVLIFANSARGRGLFVRKMMCPGMISLTSVPKEKALE